MLELRNCMLVNGEPRTIRLQGGRITSINHEIGGYPYLDLKGLTVLPGLIDVHVHDRTPPGNGEAENWNSVVTAALRGGVTYIAKMPNTAPPIMNVESLEESSRLVGSRVLPHKVWFGATVDNQREIAAVARDARVCGVKMYMGSSTGTLLVSEEADQYRVCIACADHGLTLAVHAEDEELMRQNWRLLGRQPLVSDHCLIRSTLVEVSAVQRAIRLAKATQCRLHLCHISTPEAVELAYTAKQAGALITVGVCPHHLYLDDRAMQRPEAGFFKMNPPLRGSAQVQRLRALVARSDYVDVIESDHAPHPRLAKLSSSYDQCPSGVPGLETLLPLMLRFAEEERCGLERIVMLTSTAPARLLGLSTKGLVFPGYDADLIALNPVAHYPIHHSTVAYACGWTPYNGLVASGQLRLVIIGGAVVFNSLS